MPAYFGGPSDTSAARTVFREIPNVRAIILIVDPSARCSLQISAQSSTDNNSLLSSRLNCTESQSEGGQNSGALTRGPFSYVADGLSVRIRICVVHRTPGH